MPNIDIHTHFMYISDVFLTSSTAMSKMLEIETHKVSNYIQLLMS
jgi:hypothetical protein